MFSADFDVATGALAALDLVPLQMRRFQLVRPSPAMPPGCGKGSIARAGNSGSASLPVRRTGSP